MAFWKSLSGILNPITLREFNGINKSDIFSLPESQATALKNIASYGYPALKVRPGFSNQGAIFGGAIVGLGAWKDAELHAIGGGEWKKWTGSAWSSLVSGLSATAQWSFCNFKGNFAGINLLGVNGEVVRKYDGTSVTALANCPAGARYIDAHDNRVYVAVDYSVKYSALRKAEDWTTVDDAGEIAVETSFGENISGLKAGPGHVAVFLPHAMFELYGTGPLNYKLVPVSDKIGCVSNNSALMVGGVLYFLGHDGIYQYTGGVMPDKTFALPVQWYVDNLNQANRHKACAGTDGRRYYLALPVGAATEPGHVLEFDPMFKTWYVWELGCNPRAFAFMAEKWYLGDSGGQVRQMGGTTDAGAAISWEWISKPFGETSLAQPKQWFRLWIVCSLPAGSTMNVYLSKKAEGEEWTLVKSLTAASDIQNAKVIIPVETVANANYVRVKFSGTGPATIYEMTRQERLMPFV